MDTTLIKVKQGEQLFTEAEQNWNLPVIYEQISLTKQRLFAEKQLTSLQKTILRGLLCNYSPQQIADQLRCQSPPDRFPEEVEQLVVNLTRKLHKCVQIANGIEAKAIEHYQNLPYWQDIPDWLETAGYKTQVTSDDVVEQQQSQIQQTGRAYLGKKDEIVARESFSSPSTVLVSREKTALHLSSDSQLETRPPNLDGGSLSPHNHQSQLSIIPHTETLASVDENDFLPSIGRWTKLGGMFMVASVGIAIALSAFTPYNVNVKAQAKVRPADGLKVVEAETEGTIIDIRVRSNQVVKKGEVIAVIDNSRLETRRNQLESNIKQANLQITQIQAQITAQKHRIWAETDRISRAIASAKSQLNLRRREYQDRQITATAQVTEARANLGLTKEELHQAQTELTSVQASLRSAKAALNSAISRRNRYQQIAASGALSQNQLEEAQLEVEQRQQNVVAQQATLEKQQREIAKRKQAVTAARARLKNVQVALNPTNAEVAIAFESIAQEQANGQATLAGLKQEKEALVQQSMEIQNQLERYTSELRQLEKDLKQTTIKASADGILFQLKLKNSGQMVLPGQEIARIAPSNTSLSVQALVSAQAIGNVELGQLAQAKISACPYPDYGTLKGVVSKIAPDTTIPQSDDPGTPRATSQAPGSSFYKVTIDPDNLALKKHNKQCLLQLGMEGVADITTKEETVLTFMLRKARLLTDL